MANTSYALLEKIKIVKKVLEKECGCEFAVVYDVIPENLVTLTCESLSFVLQGTEYKIKKISIINENKGILSENEVPNDSISSLITFIKSSLNASRAPIEEALKDTLKKGVDATKDAVKKTAQGAKTLAYKAASSDVGQGLNAAAYNASQGNAAGAVVTAVGADKDEKDLNLRKTDIKKPTSGKFTNAYKQAQKFLAEKAKQIIGDKAVADENDINNIIMLWINDPILTGRSAFVSGNIQHIYMMFLAAVAGDASLRKKIGQSAFNRAAEPYVAQLASKSGEAGGEDPMSPLKAPNFSSVESKIESLIKEMRVKVEEDPDLEGWFRNQEAAIEAIRSAIIHPSSSSAGSDTPGAVWITSAPGMTKSVFIQGLMKKLGLTVKMVDASTNESKARTLSRGSIPATDNDCVYIKKGPSKPPGGVVTSQFYFKLRNFPIIILDDAEGYVSGLGNLANELFNGSEPIRTLNFGAEDAIKLKTRSRIIVISNHTLESEMAAQSAVLSRVKQVSFQLTPQELNGYMKSSEAASFYIPQFTELYKNKDLNLPMEFFDKDSKKFSSFLGEANPIIIKFDKLLTTLGKITEKVGMTSVNDPSNKTKIEIAGKGGVGLRAFFNRLKDNYLPYICSTINDKDRDVKNLVLEKLAVYLNSLIKEINSSETLQKPGVMGNIIAGLSADEKATIGPFNKEGELAMPDKNIFQAYFLESPKGQVKETLNKITKAIMEHRLVDLKAILKKKSIIETLKYSDVSSKSLYEMLVATIVLKEHANGADADLFLNWADNLLKDLAEDDQHRENFTTNLRQYIVDKKVKVPQSKMFNNISEHLHK